MKANLYVLPAGTLRGVDTLIAQAEDGTLYPLHRLTFTTWRSDLGDPKRESYGSNIAGGLPLFRLAVELDETGIARITGIEVGSGRPWANDSSPWYWSGRETVDAHWLDRLEAFLVYPHQSAQVS